MNFGESLVWQTLPFWMSIDVSFFADVFEPGREISLWSTELKSQHPGL
jgi:hypothetical protein